jgi:hypothetical protein
MAKDEKGVMLGLYTYNKFYQHTQNRSKTKSFEEFAKSPYYKAFVKFGNYCINTKCIKVERFVDYVVRSNIKLDLWASDKTYTQFLDHALQTEDVGDALIRAIEYSVKWANAKAMQSHDLLRCGSGNRLCHAIVSGSLSPWVIYQTESGQKLIRNFSKEQIGMVWSTINPDVWDGIFSKRVEDAKYVEGVLKHAGW